MEARERLLESRRHRIAARMVGWMNCEVTVGGRRCECNEGLGYDNQRIGKESSVIGKERFWERKPGVRDRKERQNGQRRRRCKRHVECRCLGKKGTWMPCMHGPAARNGSLIGNCDSSTDSLDIPAES